MLAAAAAAAGGGSLCSLQPFMTESATAHAARSDLLLTYRELSTVHGGTLSTT